MSNKLSLTAFFVFILLSLCGKPLVAFAAPEFIKPVDCTLEQDCWIANYVDVDPAENAIKDFKCGPRSYDGHKGTDFAIRDLVAMETGVNVLAAADGKILRFRDGVEDEILSREELDKVMEDNRGCGNGAFIDHGDGWNTIYCHMKKDSIKVKEGQNIKQGDIIGQIGHSGFVEFPHLHFGVFFENTPIDPFTGGDETEGCGQGEYDTLWESNNAPDYHPVSIYAGGFKTAVPDFEAIKIDTTSPENASLDSDTLVFWSAIFGARKDDKIHMEIIDPLGRVFAARSLTQDKTRARQFYYVGRRTHSHPLVEGQYKGIIKIQRQNQDGPLSIKTRDSFINIR